jgi:hypothetical protein
LLPAKQVTDVVFDGIEFVEHGLAL